MRHPNIIDVNFAAQTNGQDWRTLLVGGLGKGGAAYYALDVTEPCRDHHRGSCGQQSALGVQAD